MAELCAEATIRKAAALAVRNATPLPGTAYKLGLPGQQIVDVVRYQSGSGRERLFGVHAGGRQCDVKRRSMVDAGRYPKPSVMSFDDRPANR